LENTRKVEAPEIDLMPYVGRRVRIAGVTEHRSSFKDRESYYIRVVTETVGMIGPKPLVGSRNFGLIQDRDGKTWGWTDMSKLGLYLSVKKANHYRELIGKDVVLQVQSNEEGKRFLTFE
jgi:hypothetical protein